MKFRDNYRHLGIGSQSELAFALNNYYRWSEQCVKQMRIFQNRKYMNPYFDCLLQFKSNKKTTTSKDGKLNFPKLFNSAINSNKFITCLYDKDNITEFRQTIYDKYNKEKRVMPTDDTRLRNIMDLFVLDDFDKIKSYLRNFIIKIDEADSIYINNNFGSIAEGIDGFMDLLFDHLYDNHRYKPRKFIYTTTQIYSSLPDYFQQNYKLIT